MSVVEIHYNFLDTSMSYRKQLYCIYLQLNFKKLLYKKKKIPETFHA